MLYKTCKKAVTLKIQKSLVDYQGFSYVTAFSSVLILIKAHQCKQRVSFANQLPNKRMFSLLCVILTKKLGWNVGPFVCLGLLSVFWLRSDFVHKGVLLCSSENERMEALYMHGHFKVQTGRYTYFELKGNLTNPILLNTGIKYQKSG